jgi:hypothetical protein
MDEENGAIGFLTTDGSLYCSRACALRDGKPGGYDVDQEEYESLLEGGSLASGIVCPSCGSEFAVSWAEREPN